MRKLIKFLVPLMAVSLLSGCFGSSNKNGNNGNGEGQKEDENLPSFATKSYDKYLIWDAVKDAKYYRLSFDSKEAIRAESNYFKADGNFSKVDIEAFNSKDKAIGKSSLSGAFIKSEKTLTLTSKNDVNKIASDSYDSLEFKIVNGNFSDFDFIIPDSIEYVFFNGDGSTNNRFHVSVNEGTRAKNLLIRLKDANFKGTNTCFDLNTANGSFAIIKNEGKSTISGATGVNGENSYTTSKAGGKGGNGSTAISAGDLLIVGSGKLVISGGAGGNGGNGGPSAYLTNPGAGGNGGNGGNGVSSSKLGVFLDDSDSLLYLNGGTGGTGGKIGTENGTDFHELSGISDGTNGTNGKGSTSKIDVYKGSCFAQNSETNDLSAKEVEVLPENLEVIDSPVIKRMGDVIHWDSINDATSYEVSFAGVKKEISSSSIVLDNYLEGGKCTVRALKRDGSGNLIGESYLSNVLFLPTIEIGGSNYAIYDSKESIKIPNTIDKAVITNENSGWNSSVIIENRATPLIVDLYNVNLSFIGSDGNINTKASLDSLLTIRSFGAGNDILGKDGASGANGSSGMIPSKGSNGAAGNAGIRYDYVLIEGTAPLNVCGGNGGSGGKGGDGKPNDGADGGNGGNGGPAIQTNEVFINMSDDLLYLKGGSGGSGGEGGKKSSGLITGFIAKDGARGKDGSSGEEVRGKRTVLSVSETLKGNQSKLETPVVKVEDRFIKWDAIEGASEYAVVFDLATSANPEIIWTTSTYVIMSPTRKSATVQVKAYFRDYQKELRASDLSAPVEYVQSALAEKDPAKDVVEYDLNAYVGNELVIPSTAQFVSIVDRSINFVHRDIDIVLENRTDELYISVSRIDVNFFGFKDEIINPNLVFIQEAAHATSKFNGKNAEQGVIGGIAGRFYDLILCGGSISFKGGDGFTAPDTNELGLDGTDGGTGLVAHNVYCIKSTTLNTVGGVGGKGHPGVLISEPYDGKNGENIICESYNTNSSYIN